MMWFGFLVLYDFLGMQQATGVCHVLPDNSVNSSCPFQTCATLSECCGNDLMLLNQILSTIFYLVNIKFLLK